MHFTTLAAVALAAAAPVAAGGCASVYNQCTFPVNLWSVTSQEGAGEPVAIPPGGNYTESYKTPSSGGVSLKITPGDTCWGPITQFEYTLTDMIYFDISNIDCSGAACPFQKYGLYMHSRDGCPTRKCVAGEDVCLDAYNHPKDDWNTIACDKDADIALYLCNSGAPSTEAAAPATPHRRRHASFSRIHRHGRH